jgi:hypothetical protein
VREKVDHQSSHREIKRPEGPEKISAKNNQPLRANGRGENKRSNDEPELQIKPHYYCSYEKGGEQGCKRLKEMKPLLRREGRKFVQYAKKYRLSSNL